MCEKLTPSKEYYFAIVMDRAYKVCACVVHVTVYTFWNPYKLLKIIWWLLLGSSDNGQ